MYIVHKLLLYKNIIATTTTEHQWTLRFTHNSQHTHNTVHVTVNDNQRMVRCCKKRQLTTNSDSSPASNIV